MSNHNFDYGTSNCLYAIFFTAPGHPFLSTGLCVNLRVLANSAGGGLEHLGQRGPRRRVCRLHQLRTSLPQRIHCTHWHVRCHQVGSQTLNCLLVFLLVGKKKKWPNILQEWNPELLCRCNVSPWYGLQTSCEWLSKSSRLSGYLSFESHVLQLFFIREFGLIRVTWLTSHVLWRSSLIG